MRGKKKKPDVQEFQYRLFDNILDLHQELKVKTYVHGGYHAFNISDPKPRNIHKASVRDRLLHHAVYRVLYPYFDQQFIPDSYSCRVGKGTHKATDRFHEFARKESQNHTQTVWVLKCDIRKFFASIDQEILFSILEKYISNKDILWLVGQVVRSFCCLCSNSQTHLLYAVAHSRCVHKGLPLGNLTSQLLVNIYVNEFDQYVKRRLKVKYYIRYSDDFVFLSYDRFYLEQIFRSVSTYLQDELRLDLHPDKISISTFASGVDFLGWVHFPDHRVLRTSTKKRMLRRITEFGSALKESPPACNPVVESYFGMMKHGNTEKLRKQIFGKL